MDSRRRHIRKRKAAESDEDEEEEPVELQRSVDKRAKPMGISASALMRGDVGGSIKWTNANAMSAKAGFQANAAAKRQEDILALQMEEFIQKGLDKEFKVDESDGDEELQAGPSIEDELNAVPERLEGTATIDVVIPGFNTVITEHKLGPAAQLRSIEAAEAAKKALYAAPSNALQPVSLAFKKKGKPRPEPIVPRGAFPKAFGKQRSKQDSDASGKARAGKH